MYWNQVFDLPVRAKSTQPQDMEQVHDKIYVDVFDNVSITETSEDSSVNTRSQRNWLGGCAVTFNSLYQHG